MEQVAENERRSMDFPGFRFLIRAAEVGEVLEASFTGPVDVKVNSRTIIGRPFQGGSLVASFLDGVPDVMRDDPYVELRTVLRMADEVWVRVTGGGE